MKVKRYFIEVSWTPIKHTKKLKPKVFQYASWGTPIGSLGFYGNENTLVNKGKDIYHKAIPFLYPTKYSATSALRKTLKNEIRRQKGKYKVKGKIIEVKVEEKYLERKE